MKTYHATIVPKLAQMGPYSTTEHGVIVNRYSEATTLTFRAKDKAHAQGVVRIYMSESPLFGFHDDYLITIS